MVFHGTQCSWYLSEENTLVLSESLEEGAVQILVEVAISKIFPKQCGAWGSATRNTHKSFREELKKRQDKIRQRLNDQKVSLRRALRDAVVNDVMELFPCVLFHGPPSTVC